MHLFYDDSQWRGGGQLLPRRCDGGRHVDRHPTDGLLDGAPQDEISLDGARALAARIGLPVPPPAVPVDPLRTSEG